LDTSSGGSSESGAHEIRLGPDELLRRAWPDADGSRKLLALHDLLHRDGGRDVHCLPGIVALAMPGCAFDHRRVVGNARLLRRLRDAVDVGPECDDRLAGSPGGHERRRDAGNPLLDAETVLLEDVDQVAIRFDLLKAELSETEDGVDHLLREDAHRFDVLDGVGLQALDARVVLGDGAGRSGRCDGRRHFALRKRRCGQRQNNGESRNHSESIHARRS
jgi:hypothetical protein